MSTNELHSNKLILLFALAILSLGAVPRGGAEGPKLEYQPAPPEWTKIYPSRLSAETKTYAQQLVNQIVTKNSDIVRISISIAGKYGVPIIDIGNNFDDVGNTNAVDDPIIYSRHCTLLRPREKEFVVAMPLMQKDETIIGCLTVAFKSKPDILDAPTMSWLVARTGEIRDWIRDNTKSADELIGKVGENLTHRTYLLGNL